METIYLFTPRRKSQVEQNPHNFDPLYPCMLRPTGLMLDRCPVEILSGFSTRIIDNLTAYTFGVYLDIPQSCKLLATNRLCF